MRHPGLHQAICDLTAREAPAVNEHMGYLAEHGPYKHEDAGVGTGEPEADG
jgi:predicted N-acyltransferase